MWARYIKVLVVVAVLLLPGGSAVAQSKTGTTIGQVLMIEPSARVAAMGNAGVTTFGEVQSAYFNPGTLGFLDQSEAQFTHSTWLVDITYNFAAASIQISEASSLLFTITSLNSGDIAVRTVDDPDGTGEQYSVTNLALGLGYSRRFTDRFSAGLHVKYLRETIWHSDLSAVALDFGVLYQLPFRAYLGASVSNFGTRGQYDGRDLRIRYDEDPGRFGDNSSLPAALETDDYPLPIHFRVGLGWPVSLGTNVDAQFVINAVQPSDERSDVSFGGEWTFVDIVAVRAGIQSLRWLLTDLDLASDDAALGPTLGGGLRYAVSGVGLRFDYAWAGHDRLGDMQRFTFGVAF